MPIRIPPELMLMIVRLLDLRDAYSMLVLSRTNYNIALPRVWETLYGVEHLIWFLLPRPTRKSPLMTIQIPEEFDQDDVERFQLHAKLIHHLHVKGRTRDATVYLWEGLENLQSVGFPLIPSLKSIILRDTYSQIRDPDSDRRLILLLLGQSVERLQIEFHDFASDTWHFSDAHEMLQTALAREAHLKEVYLRFTPDSDTNQHPHIGPTSCAIAMIPFSNLTTIGLSSCAISSDSLQALGVLQITSLRIWWTPYFVHEWDELPPLEGGFPSLTALHVQKIPFHLLEKLFRCIGLVAHIQKLDIWFDESTPPSLGLRRTLQNFVLHAKDLHTFTIKCLNDGCPNIGRSALRPLKNSPLRLLAMYRCNLGTEDWPQFVVTTWPTLESFIAPTMELSFAGLLGFVRGSQIRHLHFIVFLDKDGVSPKVEPSHSSQELSFHGVIEFGRAAGTDRQLICQAARSLLSRWPWVNLTFVRPVHFSTRIPSWREEHMRALREHLDLRREELQRRPTVARPRQLRRRVTLPDA